MAPKYTIEPSTAVSRRPQVLQVTPESVTDQPYPQRQRPQFNLPSFKGFTGNPTGFMKSFLQSSGAVPIAWGISMLLVAVDEWRANGILARPARLWWTSVAFFVLAIAAHFEGLRMIANLLAWGFTLQLAYQYFTGKGQFSGR